MDTFDFSCSDYEVTVIKPKFIDIILNMFYLNIFEHIWIYVPSK